MRLNNLTIIIADDDDDDKALMLEALRENGIEKNNIVLASDGEELLTVLPEYARKPCIVFLDLNMPRKDGRKTLQEIRSSESLKHIPVIIFTTSNSAEDVLASYKLGTNTYFSKPFQYRELVNLMQVIKDYWFENATIVTG
jgi:CheY-like chemotaxis protein